MSETQNVETLVQDIHSRVAAMDERVSEAALRAMLTSMLDEKLQDTEWVRKMRFGKADPALIGTKFARFNLTAADIEFAYDLLSGSAARGIGKGPSADLENAFRSISDARYLSEDEIKRIDGQALDGLFPRVSKRQVAEYERAMRAMDTAESGYGSQLIGAQYVGDLWEAARPESRVFNLINTFEMTAPTAYLPVEVDMPAMLLVSESTASNSSNYTTSKTGSNRVTVSASKFVIHQMWSGEMEEDSIIPFVPFLRMQLAKALAYYMDSLVINGDTTNAGTGNINSDDADPADTEHYLAFDGIRHAWLVDATGQGANVAGAITLNTLRDMRGRMVDSTYKHDWGHPNDPQQLVFLCDVSTGDRIALLDEVTSAKIQMGNSANLLNGQVASILGHPVIPSIAYSLQATDGKYTTTTPTTNSIYGSVTAFNRGGVVAGWRRRLKLETERIPATDQNRIVASLRMGLGRYTPTGAASGIKWAAGAYNIVL